VVPNRSTKTSGLCGGVRAVRVGERTGECASLWPIASRTGRDGGRDWGLETASHQRRFGDVGGSLARWLERLGRSRTGPLPLVSVRKIGWWALVGVGGRWWALVGVGGRWWAVGGGCWGSLARVARTARAEPHWAFATRKRPKKRKGKRSQSRPHNSRPVPSFADLLLEPCH